MTARIAILTALTILAAPTVAQQIGTCAGPGECPDFGTNIQHVKQIECGPWPDLPPDFIIRVEVPLGLVELAGARGFSQAEQCEMQRKAVTGEMQ